MFKVLFYSDHGELHSALLIFFVFGSRCLQYVRTLHTGAKHMGLFWQGQPTAHRAEQVEVNSPAVHSRQPASKQASNEQAVLLGERMGLQGRG